MFFPVILCDKMLCHVKFIARYYMYHVMSCHVMSCHVMLCHVLSCPVMSCHVMSCHVMSCHVLSCHVMSCHVMSCPLIYHVPVNSCDAYDRLRSNNTCLSFITYSCLMVLRMRRKRAGWLLEQWRKLLKVPQTSTIRKLFLLI